MTGNPKKTVQFGSAISPQERVVGTRQLTNGELRQAYELRYRTIVEELKWWPGDGSGVEMDDYDPWCYHFGNVWESGVVAYARIFHSSKPEKYMLFNEFKKVLGDERADEILKGVDEEISCEVSRLVSSPDLSSSDRRLAVLQLYGEMCRWGLAVGKTKWYIVIDERLMLRFAEFGFVFEELGRGEFFPGNGECIAACLDLQESFERVKQNPGLHDAIFKKVERI